MKEEVPSGPLEYERQLSTPLAVLFDQIFPFEQKLLIEIPDEIMELLFRLKQHDAYTAYHSVSVGRIAYQIAQELGLENTDQVYYAGLLHDMGKLFIPLEILNQTGKLTPKDFELIKEHPLHSYRMVEQIGGMDSFVLQGIVHHHERLDGKGYPYGLTDPEIPLISKIVSVADAFRAMTSSRAYQKTKGNQEALQTLIFGCNLQFSETVVDAFHQVLLREGLSSNLPQKTSHTLSG